MRSLGEVLGASARMEILQAIRYQHCPVGLRQLARLAGVHPHSAERMLKELVDEGLVIRGEARTRALYRRNPSHPEWQVLEAVFDASKSAMLKLSKPVLDKRARAILPFIEEAGMMVSRGRRSIRVS